MLHRGNQLIKVQRIVYVRLCALYIVCIVYRLSVLEVLFDFLLSVKAAPHECVIRTSQPQT